MDALPLEIVQPFAGDKGELTVHVAFNNPHIVHYLEMKMGFGQAEIKLPGDIVGIDQLRIRIAQIL